MRVREAVPMLDGHAAFAEIDLDTQPLEGAPSDAFAPRLLVYSVHLSTRCSPSKRREEIRAVARHAADVARAHSTASRAPPLATLLGGDFNQPNAADYPADEWRAIAADMRAAGLAEDDGVMGSLRRLGYVPSWERPEAHPRPMGATSAWNGALVDYVYVRSERGSQGSSVPRTGSDGADARARQPTLQVEATYVYGTLASDHLPLVVDFRV
jgi:endonuclease/exonuclease/phosphatase family metal-dependent hydrolase